MRKPIFALAVSLLALGFVSGVVVANRNQPAPPSAGLPADAAAPAEPQATVRPPLTTSAGLPDLSTVAERALKVAANITSTAIVRRNDPISLFYGGLAQRSQSLGSGVVVEPNGFILTNTHVVQDARAEIRVTLADGRELPGRILGIDDVSDLAVVKVAATNLETIPWGDSSKLRVAEWVLAIGNPFQLSGTVTLGIVSTVNRSGEQVGATSDFIQTDAAINPGNSGGALVNIRGELIGINTMILSESGGNQGIGFAIPSNTAQKIMRELIDHGEVPWGSIGVVQWVAIGRRAAQSYGYGDVSGVVAYRMERESSAYRAGVLPGDLVISVNGQPTPDGDALNRIVNRAPIGSTARLDIVRDGTRKTVNVPVVKRQ